MRLRDDPPPKPNYRDIDIVVIGSSAGGPPALRQLLPRLPHDTPWAVIVVQHMPAGYTKTFATHLNEKCKILVKEAAEGDPVLPGVAYVAPGDKNIEVCVPSTDSRQPRVRLLTGPDGVYVRPSVDILFKSVAQVYGGKVLAAILTGMGRDGTSGLADIKAQGGFAVVQDEETSAIFGMPESAIRAGLVDTVLPLDAIAELLVESSERKNRDVLFRQTFGLDEKGGREGGTNSRR